MLRFRLLLAFSALVACSSQQTSSAPDASVPERTKSPLQTLQRYVGFREHLTRSITLSASPRGIEPELARAGGLRRVSPLEVSLPNTADGTTTIASALRPGFSVTIESGDRAAPARVEGNAVVYEHARDAVDVIEIIEPARVEEIRLLGEAAPSAFTYTLRLGPAVSSVRVIDHRVELLDAAGNVGLATEKMFVVDSNGARRDVEVRIEGTGPTRTLTISFDPSGLAYPLALDPAWVASPVTVSAQENPLLHPLADGRVMFLGATTSAPTAIDPSKHTTSTLPNAVYGKANTSAVTLSSGAILIAGGGNTSELYNPSTGGTVAGSVTSGRYNQALTRVASPERVYMFGGYAPGGTYFTAVDAYDVGSSSWIPRAPLASARGHHTQTLLPGDKILIAGGATSAGDFSTSLIYDVATDSYATGPNLTSKRSFHTATMLDDGRVLLAGGRSAFGTPLSTAETYASSAFAATGAMAYQRQEHEAFKLKDGRVLVVGGWGRVAGSGGPDNVLSTTEIFDPTSNTWSAGPSLAQPRYLYGGAALPDGRVVIASGRPTTGSATSSVEIFIPDATTCTSSGPGCTCVDGYCCNTACAGQCEACDVVGYQGICVPVIGEPPHGTRTSCSPFLNCGVGGSCASSCTSDSACATGTYCAVTWCAPKKANAVACGANNECTSGYCVDGVCCNAECTSQCQACNVAGSVGTCTNVSGTPVAPRPSCTPGYACSGGACVTACTTSAGCASTHYCSGGACVGKQGFGTTCTTSDQCFSGFCVDGYCCNTACTGACEACDIPGLLGKCGYVPAGLPHGARMCTPSKACFAGGTCSNKCVGDPDCATGFICIGGFCISKKVNGSACVVNNECASGNCVDGICCDKPCFGECESCRVTGSIGTCTPQPNTVSCGPNGCSGSYLVTPGKCSGTDNTCIAGSVTACANNLSCLDTTSCRTECTDNAHCAAGYVCNLSTKTCVWNADAGPPPDGGSDALPTADAPAPTVPATPVVNGDFQRCSKDSDCPTNHCVEGVCCDTACTDRCYSCALLSNPGKCTIEPIGVDLKNECGPALTCLGTCGGDGTCIGAGTGTMCARNRCVGASNGAGPAYCAAPGAKCDTNESVPFDCEPYICEPAFGACRSNCATSRDCANGFVCDVPTKTCVRAPTVAAADGVGEDGGGCGCSTPGGRGAAGSLAATILALGLVARRRRR